MKKWIAAAAVALIAQTGLAQEADMAIHNANVYTVNKKQPAAQAVAVKDGRIIYVGSEEGLKKHVGKGTKQVNAKGQFLMPGLIEGHGHIHGMGASLMSLNLMKAKNWDEIVSMVAEAVKKAKPGDWIVGRGWHQEKWDRQPSPNYLGYPYHESLDKVSPDNPVMLVHASGHSVYVNAKAMQQAGNITEKTANPDGGDIVKDPSGKLVGVLEERAQYFAQAAYSGWINKRPVEERKATWRRSIELAEAECLRNGITSFVDAGSSFSEVAWMKELAEEKKFRVRHWVMVREGDAALKRNAAVFPIVNAGDHHLTVKAIKVSLDGALGSYGAWLLQPYSDRPNFYGQNTFNMDELRRIADFAWSKNLQLCVHAIGDRANKETIDIFSEQIRKEKGRDHRWRVEHAQHVHPSEIPRFKEWSVIASMQGIHCTSDAPFVVKRLGEERAETGAYMWRAFMDAGVLVNNGTDVPVEDIDPFANFYSSVTRKLKDGSAFYPKQKMLREEAIYSYTLANAIAQFEEQDKGSIEVGKMADMVLLSNNLLTCPEEQIATTKVLWTMVGGDILYQDKGR
jgi:predicted amidohydrolase YtcJ